MNNSTFSASRGMVVLQGAEQDHCALGRTLLKAFVFKPLLI